MNLGVALKAYLDLWRPQIAAAKRRGKEFVVGTSYLEFFVSILEGTNYCTGEYSSVSCSGKQNVTDTFGQSLWLADSESSKTSSRLFDQDNRLHS